MDYHDADGLRRHTTLFWRAGYKISVSGPMAGVSKAGSFCRFTGNPSPAFSTLSGKAAPFLGSRPLPRTTLSVHLSFSSQPSLAPLLEDTCDLI